MQEEGKQAPSDGGEGEGPHIYQVRRDLHCWRFSRREFLAATGTSAAAVAAGTLAGCGHPPTPEVITQVVTSDPEMSGVVTRVVTPASPGSPFSAEDLSPQELLAACQDLKAHKDEIYALAVTPDGKLLVSGGKDGKAKIWTLPERGLMAVLDSGEGAVYQLVVSHDARRMAVVGTGDLQWRSLPEGEMAADPELPRVEASALAMSSNGELVALSMPDMTIALWSIARGEQVASMTGHDSYAFHLAFTADDTRLISGAMDGEMRLWSLPEGELLAQLPMHSEHVGALAVDPGGAFLAYGGKDKTIRLMSLPGGDLLAELEGHKNNITGLAITPAGSLLVSCSLDGTIRLWSLPGGESLGVVDVGDKVYTLDLGPDGTWLAAAGADGTIKFWSLPGAEFAACAVDTDAISDDVEVITYEVVIESGERVKVTQPVAIQVPTGVVCVCNTVSGTMPSCSCVGDACTCVGHTVPSGGHYWYPC